MINWRSAGSRGGGGKAFIDYLLSIQTAQQGITKARVDQEPMEIGQRVYGNLRATQAECLADLAVQHPCRDDDDFAQTHDNVGGPPGCPILHILALHRAPEIWVPPVPDDDVLPDMGRMSAR
jgi:hypothetical protein